ncbi:hypothetical protein ISF6_5033 [Piscinibacter sakaiensis]|uniref:Uncharacterized protein n=1 Tax=Piscinibacter sakaiensis TaxID=1547922 RepID=A0A0K8NW87_PISS1|nr:hypothetical protein ISF6_5033 [Piscinibacter sakaiensis]
MLGAGHRASVRRGWRAPSGRARGSPAGPAGSLRGTGPPGKTRNSSGRVR